jgi:2-oxoglutarate dehydrogenase complex dehydrogenase (E1) component-like enzyme
MGAWNFVRPRIETIITKPLSYIGRKTAASTATGFKNVYEREQAAILETALASGKNDKTT